MPSRKHIRPTMDVEAITERLDRALDDLLAVRVAVGGLPVEPPAEGLDAALMADDNYQMARQAFSKTLHKFLGRVPDDLRPDVILLEGTVNELVTTSTDVGWRVGVLHGRGR